MERFEKVLSLATQKGSNRVSGAAAALVDRTGKMQTSALDASANHRQATSFISA
jgi:stage V sporulation protein SpoVS